MRLLKTDDKAAEVRLRKPRWNAPAQHASFALYFACDLAGAFAGHHQRELYIVRVRAVQETKERGMRLVLRHAV